MYLYLRVLYTMYLVGAICYCNETSWIWSFSPLSHTRCNITRAAFFWFIEGRWRPNVSCNWVFVVPGEHICLFGTKEIHDTLQTWCPSNLGINWSEIWIDIIRNTSQSQKYYKAGFFFANFLPSCSCLNVLSFILSCLTLECPPSHSSVLHWKYVCTTVWPA